RASRGNQASRLPSRRPGEITEPAVHADHEVERAAAKGLFQAPEGKGVPMDVLDSPGQVCLVLSCVKDGHIVAPFSEARNHEGPRRPGTAYYQCFHVTVPSPGNPVS